MVENLDLVAIRLDESGFGFGESIRDAHVNVYTIKIRVHFYKLDVRPATAITVMLL